MREGSLRMIVKLIEFFSHFSKNYFRYAKIPILSFHLLNFAKLQSLDFAYALFENS